MNPIYRAWARLTTKGITCPHCEKTFKLNESTGYEPIEVRRKRLFSKEPVPPKSRDLGPF